MKKWANELNRIFFKGRSPNDKKKKHKNTLRNDTSFLLEWLPSRTQIIPNVDEDSG
jgi:hypothetical protein